MRILQVIHQFPPHSSQGSEVYCLNLSRELAKSAEVRVFHVSNVARRWRRRLQRESPLGIAAYHCVDRRDYSRLAAWENPFLRRSFDSVLAEFRPDVVHFHHYLSLGDDLVSRARASGAAVVYTLHDYGLICPNALLLRDDGAICGKNDPEFFRDCCPVLIRVGRAPRGGLAAELPSLARWRLYARQQRSARVRAALGAAVELAARFTNGDDGATERRKRDFYFTHTRRIFSDAQLFVAPTRFLLERYASSGLARAKLVHSDYGMRPFEPPRRGPRHGPPRFAYIGALHPHKGIEVALEAFRMLPEARLDVFGSSFGSPISENYTRRVTTAVAPNVRFRGAYDNDRVGEVLAEVDVLVVPSLWFENSPLTIHEAFIAGVPVVASGIGGMAELVRDGIDGLHFRVGDAHDLREKIRTLIDDPGLLERLRGGIRPQKTIETDAAEVRSRYERLTRGEGGSFAASS